MTTIRDVAAAAGVSVATASRALSGVRHVTPQLEEAVFAASKRLGYRPNGVARSLRVQSTSTVGMVVPGISNPYFPHLVQAVERQLSASGRELLLCDSQDDVGIERARVHALLERRVDGLLFIACDLRTSRIALETAYASVPVVQMDRFVRGVDVDFVGVDNRYGIRAAVEHLHASGCRTFAYVGSRTLDSSAGERLAAYRRAVEAIDPAGKRRVVLRDYTLEAGTDAARILINQGPLPDAIVCAADIIALGVIAGLREAGVDIPGSVSVTGFDDIGFAAVSAPPLTTLRQPADQIGALAVQLLSDRQSGSTEKAGKHRVRPRLVVRASTRPIGG